VFESVAVLEVGRKVAGLGVGAASDRDLCAAALVLAELQSLVAVGQARVLAELDVRGVCDVEFGLTTASWLAREAMLPGRTTRGQVKVGRRLSELLPDVEAAVGAGRINAHHASVLAEACHPRVADAVAGLQTELVALAEGASFERWRAEVRGIVELLDEDGGHDPNDDLARNRLDLAESLDGVTHVAGRLVGEHALGVSHAIETRADELFRRYAADHHECPDIGVPSRATLRALALAELCRAAGAVDVSSTRPPRPEVTMVVRADEPGAGPTGPTGATLPDGTTRTLRCDPDLFTLVVDSLGVPLDMGRHVRLATTAQRRALAARDGGCTFPGCDRPHEWCDVHHVDPFEQGGHTNLDRLAPLCRTHHGVSHRRGWRMFVTDDGWFWWQSPTGRTFWSQRHRRRRGGPAPPPVE
jgi:hypothetical protein